MMLTFGLREGVQRFPSRAEMESRRIARSVHREGVPILMLGTCGVMCYIYAFLTPVVVDLHDPAGLRRMG